MPVIAFIIASASGGRAGEKIFLLFRGSKGGSKNKGFQPGRAGRGEGLNVTEGGFCFSDLGFFQASV